MCWKFIVRWDFKQAIIDRMKSINNFIQWFSRIRSIHYALLFIGLSLSYIWSSEWFVTTDGPSHAYNAMLLGEYLFGDWSYFGRWLEVFAFPFPNWTGHLVLSALLQIFILAVAEKVLFSFYAILYFLGLHRLAKTAQLNPWLLIGLFAPFLFPQTFATGFYNYQLGYAILPWFLSAFLKLNDGATLMRWFTLLIVSLIAYFTHPIPYLLFWMIAGLFVLFQNKWWSSWVEFRRTLVLVSPLILSLALMAYFLKATVDGATSSPVESSVLMDDFLALTSLMNYNLSRELVVTVSISLFLGILLLLSLKRFIVVPKSALQWSFLMGFLIMTLFYFFQPGSFSSAGILTFRIQFIPHLFFILFASTLTWPKWMNATVGIAFVTLFSLALIIRLPHKLQASTTMSEMMTACDKMEKNKVAVGLNCFHNGFYGGKIIAKSNWIFTHCADYVNTETRQLSLVNYESNQFHFPMKWKQGFDAYAEMACNEGLEHIPPCVSLDKAEDKFDLEVDYVFFLFPNQAILRDHVNYKTSLANLGDEFELIYTSETGVIELFKRIHFGSK